MIYDGNYEVSGLKKVDKKFRRIFLKIRQKVSLSVISIQSCRHINLITTLTNIFPNTIKSKENGNYFIILMTLLLVS